MKFIFISQPKGSNYVCFARQYDTLEAAKHAGEKCAEHELDWPKAFWDGQMSLEVIEGEDTPIRTISYIYTIVRDREED